MKKIASQINCDAKVSFWKGGNAGLAPPWAWVCAVFVAISRSSGQARSGKLRAPSRLSALEGEQQEKRDQQREDAERFGHREAENQVAELALRGRRIAERGGKVIAENRADADAGAAHADAGDACANVFRCDRIH